MSLIQDLALCLWERFPAAIERFRFKGDFPSRLEAAPTKVDYIQLVACDWLFPVYPVKISGDI